MDRIKKLLFSGTSKDAFISLIGNALVAIAGMLFSVLVARALAPAKFGVFSAIYALAMILSSLGDLGISSALINFLPKKPESRQAIVSIAFWVQLSIGVLLFIIAISLIPFGNIIIPRSKALHFFLLGLLGFVLCLEVFSTAIFKAEKRFLWASAISSIDSWIKLSLVALLFFFFTPTIANILISAVVAATLATTIGLSFEFGNVRRIFPLDQVREIFKFTKWITLMQVFNVFIGRLDTVLLNALHSDIAAGIFAAASRVTLVFVLVVSTLGSVVSPRFSGFNKNEHTKSYLKKLMLLVTTIAFFMALTSLLAPIIITLVFGPSYSAAIPVFRALTLAMIPFLFTIITINPLIYTFNKPDFVAKVTVTQVFLLITIDVLLIPSLGAFAPAISLAISNLFTLSLTSYKLKSLLS